MKIYHLVKVHFDRRTPAITQEWLDERYEFFLNNTLKSLERQTFKDWTLWFSFGDEGMRSMCQNLMKGFLKSGVDVPMVLSFRDHKPDVSLLQGQDCDYVYVTRVDSDDLFAPDALQIAHDTPPQESGRVEASMFRRGYLHDVRTGETGVYHGSSTPFHTMLIPRDVFCDPVRYRAIDYGDHSLVNTRYPTQVLPDWRFTVLVHGRNFISDMSYGRERIFNVESSWSVERFLRQPVTFDVDDFCDRWNCLPALDRLKEQYPNFRCTLFTIPAKTSRALMMRAKERDWIELALHGITHEPNEELKDLTANWLHEGLYPHAYGPSTGEYFVKGFRPPGWYIRPEQVEALNRMGVWVALHKRDERTLGPLCERGYYCCGDRPYWHGHTSGDGQRAHSVCKNGIDECLPELLRRWPRDQHFSFVSESVGKIQ